ncbi:MAG TPA: hypothetical protein VMU89_24010 [Thermomicrobiaceae bacterium]|nr:hypothetical protein [Thermomicrobiaceae bacterium]
MSRLVSPGIVALLLVLVAGAWLISAPVAIGFQPTGAAWLTATKNDVAVGGLLVAVALVGVLGFLMLALRDLVRAADLRRAEAEAEPVVEG